MRPEPVRILAKKMVIVALVNNDGNLRHIGRALRREITHNRRRSIPHDAYNEIWTRLGIRIGELLMPGRLARLMEGDIAVSLLTLFQLLLVENIHRIGETVVRLLEFRVQIPASRLVRRLYPSQRTYTRTIIFMGRAECLPLYSPIWAFYRALTLMLSTRFVKVLAAFSSR